MHVHLLPIPSISVEYCGHDYQLVFRNKVPYASLELVGIVLCNRVEIELEGRGEGQNDEQQAAEEA